MKKIILLILMLLSSSTCFGQISKQEAIKEFVQGNLSYKEADYQRAIEKYESIIEKGKASGEIYYNLANSYYKNGDLGRAILNYERAKRLLPRDGDVNFNHKYVLSKTNVFEGEIGLNIFQRMFKNHINFYSVNEMVLITLILVIMLALIHLLFLYNQWPPHIGKSLFLFVLMLFLVFSTGLFIKTDQQKDQAIMLTRSDARFEPRNESTVHYKINAGSMVRIIRDESDWVKIKREDGRLGWVQAEKLEEI